MRAASIDAEGYVRWRARAGRATVHSVFERVINLRSAGGDLFAIAAAGADDAPDTVVAAGPLAVAGVAPGELVHASAERLAMANGIELAIAGARPWRPVLPAYPAHQERLRRHLGVVRRSLAAVWAPCTSVSPLGRELAGLLAHRRQLLCAAIAAGDRDAACRHGQAMLGLGPGLTPSGDDFLAGFLVVLHLPGGPGETFQDLGELIVNGAERCTNAISVAMLRAAAQGRVRERVIALLRELVAGEPHGVDGALGHVLAIGSSSGGDMAAGIVAAFDVQLHLAGAAQAGPSAAVAA